MPENANSFLQVTRGRSVTGARHSRRVSGAVLHLILGHPRVSGFAPRNLKCPVFAIPVIILSTATGFLNVGLSEFVPDGKMPIAHRETGHSGMTKYQIESGARHSRRVSGAVTVVGETPGIRH
eukprot:COSAG02_NODE_3389_length_6827_cov_2.578627_5_plen_123_part_00